MREGCVAVLVGVDSQFHAAPIRRTDQIETGKQRNQGPGAIAGERKAWSVL